MGYGQNNFLLKKNQDFPIPTDIFEGVPSCYILDENISGTIEKFLNLS